MQLNSLYTTHDMRLSNILQQYDYTFSYGLKLFTIWHSILVILVLFLKFFNPFLEKSTRHFKTEKNIWHSLTVSTLLVWNNFINKLLTIKSNESKSKLVYLPPGNISAKFGPFWLSVIELREVWDRQTDGQPQCIANWTSKRRVRNNRSAWEAQYY